MKVKKTKNGNISMQLSYYHRELLSRVLSSAVELHSVIKIDSMELLQQKIFMAIVTRLYFRTDFKLNTPFMIRLLIEPAEGLCLIKLLIPHEDDYPEMLEMKCALHQHLYL